MSLLHMCSPGRGSIVADCPTVREALPSSDEQRDIGHPYGAKIAGWLTINGTIGGVGSTNNADDDNDLRSSMMTDIGGGGGGGGGGGDQAGTKDNCDGGSGSTANDYVGVPLPLGERRWFVLRRTCLEVFSSPASADGTAEDDDTYSALPIPYIALIGGGSTST